MSKKSDIFYLIQVRTGSTRLKNKMLLPFFDGLTIPEIIIERILEEGICSKNIIILTTKNENENILIDNLSKYSCKIFRGDEENVLKRFIDAAEQFNIEYFFRICADNPFLNINFIKNILETDNLRNYDYVSYITKNETPAIKTHFGLFCEYTNYKALKRIYNLTNERFFTEHVTSFIYNNPELFKIKMLSIPTDIENNEWLRLTIDTKDDFNIIQNIFEKTVDKEDYLEVIANSFIYKDIMLKNVNDNSK